MIKEFYGFKDRLQLIHKSRFIPNICDSIVTKVSVSNRSKKCIGSIDGINYIYSDGTSDKGILINRYIYENDKYIFIWDGS